MKLQGCQLLCKLQVLDHTVAPVLSAFATARDTQQSQMLNPLRLPEVDAQCQDRLHLSAPAAVRGLQLLPKLQDWAMFGVLICPGTGRTEIQRSKSDLVVVHNHADTCLLHLPD